MSVQRCAWAGNDPLYIAYHDEEWGVPEYDARALWEKLVLDGFQAGLAWITILRKREGMREAFHGFDPEIIARYDDADRARLLADPRFGPVIRDWERAGAVSRRAKRLATAMMSICAVLLFATAPRAWMAGIGTLVMALVAAWLWRRPEPRH